MTCRLFVELCAGTAAVSLRLARARARPPVSRMGAKTGYADAILGLAGLAPGQGAGHYLWCEPDPGCRLLLEAYRDAALAKAAADIIRGWADEDPRALWERLRAEGPPRYPAEAREMARWAWVQGRGFHGSAWGTSFLPIEHPVRGTNGTSPKVTADRLNEHGALPATILPDARQVDPREVARWACSSYLSYGQDAQRGFRATAGGCWPDDPPDVRTQATRLEGLPTFPATILPDARQVDPREVARWGLLGAWAYRSGHPESGPAGDGRWADTPWRDGSGAVVATRVGTTAEAVAGRYANTPTLPATILPDAHAADPGPALPPGTVVLFDPPYQGTTPYAHDLPRADVVALARRWAAAGALVLVCEAEPIPELLADGWGYRDIAHARMGQKRTFSRQQREVVTMSRPPVHVPAEQVGLFGGGR